MRFAALLLAATLAASLGSLAAASDEVRKRGAPEVCIGEIFDAFYEGSTDRYAHGVLGDAIEWSVLTVAFGGNEVCPWRTNQLSVELQPTRVFEDTAPRLADLDGDGIAEMITVESALTQGARLTVWGQRGGVFRRVATTPFIGRANRWLAPVAAADLDGDGQMELAYVDRPHLAKTLRVWRFYNDTLTEVAALSGVSNHRIGEDYISGGLRDCGGKPEMVLADAAWRKVLVVAFDGRDFDVRDVAAFTGRHSFAQVLECKVR